MRCVVPHERLDPSIPDFIKAAFADDTIRLLSDGWYLKSHDLLGHAGLLGGALLRESLHKLEEGDYLVKGGNGNLFIQEADEFAKWYRPVEEVEQG